jgi:hypothetical protein
MRARFWQGSTRRSHARRQRRVKVRSPRRSSLIHASASLVACMLAPTEQLLSSFSTTFGCSTSNRRLVAPARRVPPRPGRWWAGPLRRRRPRSRRRSAHARRIIPARIGDPHPAPRPDSRPSRSRSACMKHHEAPRVMGKWVLTTCQPTCNLGSSDWFRRREPSSRRVVSTPRASCPDRFCASRRSNVTSRVSSAAARNGSTRVDAEGFSRSFPSSWSGARLFLARCALESFPRTRNVHSQPSRRSLQSGNRPSSWSSNWRGLLAKAWHRIAAPDVVAVTAGVGTGLASEMSRRRDTVPGASREENETATPTARQASARLGPKAIVTG